MQSIDYNRNIPVKYSVDVFVAGGGPSGVAAAVTASRQGRKIFLAEAHTCFGGMGTAGRVPMFCKFSDDVNFLAGGIGREIYEKCFSYGSVGPDDYADANKKMNSITIRAEVLKRIYDDMVTGSGSEFSFLTRVVDVEIEAGNIAYVICCSKSGIFAIKADIYIDCTGDGDLSVKAGAEFEKGDSNGDMQPGTLCSLWTGMDWDVVKKEGYHDLWPNNAKLLVKAVEDGIFTVPDIGMPGMWIVSEKTGGGNIGHTFGLDGTDEKSYTNAMIWGRKSLTEYEKYYKEYLKGFENIELVATGELLGVRETRRIIGDYVLTVEDFKKRAVFDDEIGRYNYEVDIHCSKPDRQSQYESEMRSKEFHYSTGESYGIPYRTLTPKGISNLLVAGRCISTDRHMQGSIRVMPGCIITGQAAGMAAAIASEMKSNVREVKVKSIQERLKKIGAFLPNYAGV